MTANAGYHAYATGDVLTAAQVQYNLQNQTVMYFATTTARDAALTGAILVEGMVSYTPATGLMYYNGTAWTAVGASNVPTLSNPVLNSAFQIWQRGTSFSASGLYYFADRWAQNNGGTAITASRVATGDTTNLPNIQYAAQLQRTAASTSTAAVYVFTTFESVNSIPFAGKTVTISWYARVGANWSGGNPSLTLYSGTGIDQSLNTGFTGVTSVAATSNTITTTWQRFTATGTVASTATQLAFQISYAPSGTAGANDWIQFTGVQLELGSVATPFDTYATTIQGELAACQRYYFNYCNNTTQNIGIATFNNTTQGETVVQFPVTMRTAPTLAVTTGSGYYLLTRVSQSSTSLTIFGASTTSALLYSAFTSLTAGQSDRMMTNNASANISFSAEL